MPENTDKRDDGTNTSDTGDQNTDDKSSGDQNTDNKSSGDQDTGDQDTGDQNTGDQNTDDKGSGDTSLTGGDQTGDDQTGDTRDDTKLTLDPKDYKLPEWAPDDWRNMVAERGYTQEQLDAAIKQFEDYNKTTKQLERQNLKKQAEDLIKDWGDAADHNINLARQGLRYVDPEGELRKVLNDTGYGDHPAAIKAFMMIGKQLEESGFLKSDVNRVKTKGRSLAERLYPTMNKE